VQQPSVLIARNDGVIVVPGAVPVSHGWVAGVAGLYALLDSHDAPRPRGETRGDQRDEPGTMSA
jgi:hypothetical protein